MTRFLYGELLWKTITARAKKAKRTKAAIAYVTRLEELYFKSGDVLVVDATDGAIASGQTSAAVLAKLLKKGVRLFSHAGLHAKIVLVDSVLFASSANLSESSVNKLFEAGLETDHPNAVSGAAGLIESLIPKSAPIAAKFIIRIKKIDVTRRHFVGKKSNARTAPKHHREPVTWLWGMHPNDDPKDPEELKRSQAALEQVDGLMSNPKSSIGSMEGPRNSRIAEARAGDSVVLIYRRKREGEPEQVLPHAPVLLVDSAPNCVTVYFEILPNADNLSLSWAQFKKAARLSGFRTEVSKDSLRQLPTNVSANLKDYWEEARGQRH